MKLVFVELPSGDCRLREECSRPNGCRTFEAKVDVQRQVKQFKPQTRAALQLLRAWVASLFQRSDSNLLRPFNTPQE